jgi:hypothetical protein
MQLLQKCFGDIVTGKPRCPGGREEVEAGRGKNREGEKSRNDGLSWKKTERHGYGATRIGKRKWKNCESRLRKLKPN